MDLLEPEVTVRVDEAAPLVPHPAMLVHENDRQFDDAVVPAGP
jgi:hypothetical protein